MIIHRSQAKIVKTDSQFVMVVISDVLVYSPEKMYNFVND